MAVNLSPIWVGTQFFTSPGVVLAGGQIFQYLAGTTTPAATFTDTTGAVSNANPIILDSAGRYSQQIWFAAGVSYKLVLETATGTILLTEDNLTGVNDVSLSSNSSEWTATGITPTYTGPSSFTTAGDARATFQVGRRVQATIATGNVYGTILTSTFSGGLTTVTLAMDTATLDSTLSAVSVALLGALHPSVPASLPYAITVGGLLTANSGANISGPVTASGVVTMTNQASVYGGELRIGTNPNQPAFFANLTAVISSLPANATIPGWTVVQQNGSGLNAAAGVYTAPVSGWYVIGAQMHIASSGATSPSSVILVAAGQTLSSAGNNAILVASGSGYNQFWPLFGCVYMAAGQTAYMFSQQAFSATFFLTQANFYGALLY